MSPLAHLTDRALLGIGGADARAFLQGLITQDITQLTPQAPLYAAHLTHQGRFLYDFMVLQLGDKVMLDCHVDDLLPLAKALHHYQLREQIAFEDLRADYHIYASWGEDGAEDGRKDGIAPTAPTEGLCYADPRLPALGWRLVLPADAALPATATLADYHAHRIALTVPDGHTDAQHGKTIANELRLGDLHGISYEKGCYVGQELTARTHFRSPPKKQLMAVHYSAELPAPTPGTLVLRGTREVGQVFSCRNGRGIAILRVEELAKPGQLTAGDLVLTAVAPAWAEQA